MTNLSEQQKLFAQRLIAKAIDFFIIGLCERLMGSEFGLLFGIAYILASDGFFHGQSLGKRIVGISVSYVNAVGARLEPCPYSQSAIRNLPFALILFLSAIPILGWLFMVLGLIFIAIEIYFMYSDEEGIRIGDIYAKTKVSVRS